MDKVAMAEETNAGSVPTGTSKELLSMFLPIGKREKLDEEDLRVLPQKISCQRT
jgi:hypothetical protein